LNEFKEATSTSRFCQSFTLLVNFSHLSDFCASLLNRSLQAKGITAKANIKENGYLQVMLESSQIPSRIPEVDDFLYRVASR